MVKVGFPNQVYLILKCEKIIVTLFLIPFLASSISVFLCCFSFSSSSRSSSTSFTLSSPSFFFSFCLIYKSQNQYILIMLIILKLLRRFLRRKYLSVIPVLYYICLCAPQSILIPQQRPRYSIWFTYIFQLYLFPRNQLKFDTSWASANVSWWSVLK